MEPQKGSGETDLLILEQCLEALHRESAEGALDNLEHAELRVFLGDFLVAANLVEDVFGEPGVRLVVVGDTVDGSDGLSLATTRQQELGRFVKMEEEEAADEHEERDRTEGQDEVSPAPVVGLAALPNGSTRRA